MEEYVWVIACLTPEKQPNSAAFIQQIYFKPSSMSVPVCKMCKFSRGDTWGYMFTPASSPLYLFKQISNKYYCTKSVAMKKKPDNAPVMHVYNEIVYTNFKEDSRAFSVGVV